MKTIILTLLLMTTSCVMHAFGQPERQKINNDQGKEIHYYLLQASAERSKNLLILIQGADCKSVINNLNMVRNFGVAFPDNDILLVEKTGLDAQVGKDYTEVPLEDCPMAYMKNDSPLERADNYLLLINKLNSFYDNIVLIGGSEGAIVVNIISAKTDKIKAAVSMNSGGQFFINDIINSIENSMPKEQAAEAVEGYTKFAREVVQSNRENDQLMSGHGNKWWREVLTLNNQRLIQSTKAPLLVIQALRDINVDPHSAKSMMKHIDNPKVVFKTYSDLDHFFVDSDKKPQTTVVVNDIQQWYKSIDKYK